MFGRILFPTDGSETAQRAGEHALEIAERFDGELVVCFVIEQHYLYAGPSGPAELWDEIVGKARDAANERTEVILREARARGIPAERVIVEHPKVAESILEVAGKHEVDGIVMGTHGRSRIKRFLLGSVAERVLRGSDVPVVMIPPAEEER